MRLLNDSQTISLSRLSDLYEVEIIGEDGIFNITADMVDTSEMNLNNVDKEITITYHIEDSYSNVLAFTRKYILKDEEVPHIELTDSAKSHVDLNENIDLKSYFYAYDDYDGEIEITNDNIDASQVKMDEEGIYPVTVTVTDKSNNVATYVFHLYVGINQTYLSNYSTNQTIKTTVPGDLHAMPSTGDVNVLVVPVSLDADNESKALIEKIDKAFNGDDDEISWMSVSTYYKKSSYNKLNLNFTVLDEWVRTKYNSNYYLDHNYELFTEVLASVNSYVDFANYDSDEDGYIDAVWFIYNIDYNVSTSNKFYWAFVTSLEDTVHEKYDGKNLAKIGFASYEFLSASSSQNAKYNEAGIVSRTYIHETGHMLGLDDYYDYDYDYSVGVSHAMLEADMMDSNIGDHNAASKILLGWIDPIVIKHDGNIKITPTTLSGDAILISKDIQKGDNIFSEYIILEFYSAVGINEHDASIAYGKRAYGIRVLHLDATINYQNGISKETGKNYISYFKYNNTDYDSYNFLEVLASNPSDVYRANSKGGEYNLVGNVLFSDTNVIFGKDIYQDFTYHNGNPLDFTFEILNISKEEATLKILFN